MASINYNDKRFTQVKNQESTDLKNVNNLYNTMVNNSDKYYNNLINASQQYADKQTEIQNQQTDFAIEKVEQQKEWAEQDYVKEQKGAYTDWQKQSNQYGAVAEANANMIGTGYAESSQVQMYTAYQNRVATARESYNRAVVEYDMAIKDARLQNSAKLAEIAYQALQQKLELSLEGFQYKNTLLQQKLTAQNDVKDRYYNRWKDVQSQINTEKALAEQVRQFNEQMAFERQQASRSGGGSYSGIIPADGGSTGTGSPSINKQQNTSTFSNGYQPDNINGQKLKSSGLKVWNVFSEGTSQKNATTFGKQNIWTAGGKYYVWVGNGKKGGEYVDVTSKVKSSQKNKVNYQWGR